MIKPEFTGPDIRKQEAHEVVELLRRGDISAKELLEASFNRVEAVEPLVNAMPTTCYERAQQAAEKLNPNESDSSAWLAGLPVGIKDLTPVS